MLLVIHLQMMAIETNAEHLRFNLFGQSIYKTSLLSMDLGFKKPSTAWELSYERGGIVGVLGTNNFDQKHGVLPMIAHF
jgi:hypothetical protein